MNLFHCKKANIQGPVLIIISILFLAFCSILTVMVLISIRTSLTTAGVYDGTVASSFESFIDAVRVMDNVMVFIMVSFFILTALTSFKVSSNPAFFVVSIITVIFLGFISYFFNYVFISLISPAVFSAVITAFPKSIIICTNLHWVALIDFVIGGIALYGKKPKGQFVE